MKATVLILSFAGLLSLQTCSTDDDLDGNCDQLFENWQNSAASFTSNQTSSNCEAYLKSFVAYYENGCPGYEYYDYIWEEFAQEVWNNPENYCEIYDDYYGVKRDIP